MVTTYHMSDIDAYVHKLLCIRADQIRRIGFTAFHRPRDGQYQGLMARERYSALQKQFNDATALPWYGLKP